jgi:hypothetical protein
VGLWGAVELAVGTLEQVVVMISVLTGQLRHRYSAEMKSLARFMDTLHLDWHKPRKILARMM